MCSQSLLNPFETQKAPAIVIHLTSNASLILCAMLVKTSVVGPGGAIFTLFVAQDAVVYIEVRCKILFKVSVTECVLFWQRWIGFVWCFGYKSKTAIILKQ